MSDPGFTLLLVDDDPMVLESLQTLLAHGGYSILTAADAGEALRKVEVTPIDAALIDLQLPRVNGIELLKQLKERFPQAQLCIITGAGGVPDAVEAIRSGAVDFLQKPLVAETLMARISRIHEVWRLRQEAARRAQRNFADERLIGNSASMGRLRELISRVAPTDVSVLIQGETGSGKELVARAVHLLSSRSERAFTVVDCASISEHLLESEIFGHVKGSFTGADAAHPGIVRASDGGTIFFDEIGELPLQVQAKLLRLLQEHEVRPIGSVKSFPVDVRVIAATNRDLAQEVKRKVFREDLYYRLNVLAIRVPALRERREDIPILARHFVESLRTESSPQGISEEAVLRLQRHDWPGNVRELENAIRRALVLGQDASIRLADLPAEFSHTPPTAGGRDGTMAGYEAEAIRDALARSGGNRKAAARILGIGEATLYRKLREYGIE